jgi:hypothetical protein
MGLNVKIKNMKVIKLHYYYYHLFSLNLQPNSGYGTPVSRGFLITHNDAPLSVRLLWTSDQLVASTST